MLRNDVGLKIKAIREQKGISQAALANKSKITAAYLCELESGAKDNPSYGVLKKLATALGVSVAELLVESPKITSADGVAPKRVQFPPRRKTNQSVVQQH